MAVRCLRCGAQVEGLKQFCDDCASTQPRSVYEPGPPVDPSAPVTGSTPADTGLRCLRCGSSLPANAEFCPVCGTAVAGGARPEMVYAGFWMRFLAAIADGIVLGAINFPIGFLVDDLATAFLLQTTVGAIYTLFFWITKGATPGKMALSMQIVMEDGQPLTGGAAVLRYIGYYVNVLTLGIGYLMIAFTREKRGLHDYIAGTVVVRKG